MKYRVIQKGRSVELSEGNRTIRVYRIPYQDLQAGEIAFEITNKFVVYILFGENEDGKDVVYVGKSKNGLDKRPKSHEDRYNNWGCCYILTQINEGTFFNDGTIQYIEDQVNKRVNDINHYDNRTRKTTSGTANPYDMPDCDEYLSIAYDMLDVLGLDLITFMDDNSESEDVFNDQFDSIIPNGKYHMLQKLKRWGGKQVKADMEVIDGKYILLKGSVICPYEGKGLRNSIRIRRENANIEEDVLMDDLVFTSPSGASRFVCGAASNGWKTWKDEGGNIIDKYRANNI